MKSKMAAVVLVPLLFIIAVAVSGCTEGGTSSLAGEEMTIYKSSNCGCCGNYASYAEGLGLKVNIVDVQDIDAVKDQYNIPQDMQSCHTIVIGDYFVEGHVPIEAVEKLMTEHPDIEGIALPGMPSGSPGMPGSKTGEWTIYAINDGEVTEFMMI